MLGQYKNLGIYPACIVGCKEDEIDNWAVKFCLRKENGSWTLPFYAYFKTQEGAGQWALYISSLKYHNGKFESESEYTGEEAYRVFSIQSIRRQAEMERDQQSSS